MEIKSAGLNALGQIDKILEQIHNDDYNQPIPALGDATIGQHIRHTLEFFLCLQKGMASGTVNYDQRERSIVIETDPGTARLTLNQLRQFISKAPEHTPLIFETSYSEDPALTKRIPSSFERELAYNIEHAVHHMAIFKIGIADVAKYVEIPDGFGVALSTLRYQKE